MFVGGGQRDSVNAIYGQGVDVEYAARIRVNEQPAAVGGKGVACRTGQAVARGLKELAGTVARHRFPAAGRNGCGVGAAAGGDQRQ